MAEAAALDRAYRVRLDATRTSLAREVRRAFEGVDPADLDGAFAAFVDDVVPRIEGGKAAAQLLAVTYLEDLAEELGIPFEPEPEDEDIATRTGAGSVSAGLAAIMPMVKGAIGAGRAVTAAITFGGSLVERFVDAEVTRAADEETERQSALSDRITGWEGVTAGSSCDRCARNAGFHDLNATFYRHPGCNCLRRVVFAASNARP